VNKKNKKIIRKKQQMQGQIKMFKSFQDISGRVSYLPFSSWQIYEVPRKAT